MDILNIKIENIHQKTEEKILEYRLAAKELNAAADSLEKGFRKNGAKLFDYIRYLEAENERQKKIIEYLEEAVEKQSELLENLQKRE